MIANWFAISPNYRRIISVSLLIVFCQVSVLHQRTQCADQVVCPPYHGYLDAGNACVFFIESCYNFTSALQKCQEKLGDLVSLIYNYAHFNQLCDYARKRLPENAFFFLRAKRKHGLLEESFLWDLDKSKVDFQIASNISSSHACLAMSVSKFRCSLKDVPCHKTTWPFCEFRHANPCVYNNGACEGKCVPRHRGDRKCVCSEGYTSIGTRCYDNKVKLTCPGSDSSIHVKENICFANIKLERSKGEGEDECEIHNRGLIMFQNASRMKRYCRALLDLQPKGGTYFIDGHYSLDEKRVYLQQTNSFYPLLNKCPINNPHEISQTATADNCLALYVATFKCCILIKNCVTRRKSICGMLSPNICLDDVKYQNCSHGKQCYPQTGYRKHTCLPCPNGYKWDEVNGECVQTCYKDIGGCSHVCQYTNGSVQCGCHDGYELYNDTECRYKDRCMAHDGENGCPVYFKLGGNGTTCGMSLNDDNSVSDSDNKNKEEFTEWYAKNGQLVLLFILFIVCCVAILACVQMGFIFQRLRKNRQETTSDNDEGTFQQSMKNRQETTSNGDEGTFQQSTKNRQETTSDDDESTFQQSMKNRQETTSNDDESTFQQSMKNRQETTPSGD